MFLFSSIGTNIIWWYFRKYAQPSKAWRSYFFETLSRLCTVSNKQTNKQKVTLPSDCVLCQTNKQKVTLRWPYHQAVYCVKQTKGDLTIRLCTVSNKQTKGDPKMTLPPGCVLCQTNKQKVTLRWPYHQIVYCVKQTKGVLTIRLCIVSNKPTKGDPKMTLPSGCVLCQTNKQKVTLRWPYHQIVYCVKQTNKRWP